ncbi:MAG: hypothetical protein ACI914_001571 [Candidatus Marivariicella framensis]|jgi:hypothetical protein
MSNTLKYYRIILRKVSFDADLFSKELKKAYRHLSKEDSSQLYIWTLIFIKKHPHLIEVQYSF